MFETLFIEDAKTLVNGFALLLDLFMYLSRLRVELGPIWGVGVPCEIRRGSTVVDVRAAGVVGLNDFVLEVIVLVLADVEDQFLTIQEVINLIDEEHDPVLTTLHLVTNVVECERLLEIVE